MFMKGLLTKMWSHQEAITIPEIQEIREGDLNRDSELEKVQVPEGHSYYQRHGPAGGNVPTSLFLGPPVPGWCLSLASPEFLRSVHSVSVPQGTEPDTGEQIDPEGQRDNVRNF